MDLVVALPLSKQGSDAIIVFVDKLTKMVAAAPCKSSIPSVGVIAKIVNAVVLPGHGYPLRLVCDRDPRFTSAEFQEWCSEVGCKCLFSSAYHPETDGQTERMNALVLQVLRQYISPTQEDWEDMHCL